MSILKTNQEHLYNKSRSRKPRYSGLSQLVTEIDPHSGASEAYRILKTNLNFINIDDKLKYIAMTSSVAAEGKSTTTANLAITLAQGGKKVILVDADLRKPTQHKIFGLNVFEGLTNSLVEGTDPLSLCREFNGPGFKILTSGPLPPNPSELLGSARMKSVLERLGSAADTIIIDCPPILGLNDTLAVAPNVDGYLLVIGVGRVTKEELNKAKAQLDRIGANLVGAIVNGFNSKENNDYYNYYTNDERTRK